MRHGKMSLSNEKEKARTNYSSRYEIDLPMKGEGTLIGGIGKQLEKIEGVHIKRPKRNNWVKGSRGIGENCKSRNILNGIRGIRADKPKAPLVRGYQERQGKR